MKTKKENTQIIKNSNANSNTNANVNSNKKINSIKIRTQKYMEKREKKDICYDILAWIASLSILSAYIFNLQKTEISGFILNTIGAFFFVVVCYDRGEYQVFAINVVWFWGSIYEFIKYQIST